jgi:hypothetical protein
VCVCNSGHKFRVRWIPCHNGMARSQVAVGGEGVQICRVAANTLHKQSQAADKGRSSGLGIGCEANNPSP